jgi:hypothetical protein
MSFRFRIKVGPIVYDEDLSKPADRRPSLLTKGDLFVLGYAALFLVFLAVMVVIQ